MMLWLVHLGRSDEPEGDERQKWIQTRSQELVASSLMKSV